MSRLTAVRIRRFKAIDDAPFDLSSLNVLVGANNSGKSSIIQGLHFAIGLLQTIKLSGYWTKGASISTSINPTQLIYSPSDDVASLALGGKLLEKREAAIEFQFTLASGETPTVSVRKGRNRNILVGVTDAVAAERLAQMESPFSVFSPGLAGVSKTEQYVSDGVLLRTIARGDANLVLRNILLRLWDSPEWEAFISDLREIFPNIEFTVEFDKQTDEFIGVSVKMGEELVPLELVGTGVLQAAQILSYIHNFAPKLVVLDEPDSHLHPNNQRLLCGLLRKVAEDRSTQILLTTHSRHVVDAIGGPARYLWVRKGTVESASADDEIGILLDIGALDVKERAGQPGTKAIVLTEDENTRPLEAILKASGFDADATAVLPYFGVNTIKQLRPLVRMVAESNPDAKLVVHRDRDYLSNEEVEEWKKKVRKLGVEPVVTTGVDVESEFLSAEHLSAVNSQRSPEEFDRLLDEARTECVEKFIEKYVNGRIDIERSFGNHAKIDHGKLAVEAATIVRSDLPRWAHGKTLLKALREKYRREYGANMQDTVPSEHAAMADLITVAKKTFSSGEGRT